ncbi:MAG: S41 family peptidase [Bacilli bacterium]|nr:S41 family peptidase [Bacilli bacterium]
MIVGGLIGIKFKEKNTVIGDIEIAGEEIQDFLKDYNYLIENYYGDIDKKELLNTAFKSMVDSLGDSYSGALDESTSNNFDIELKGDYEGLGIEIINDSEKNILIYGIIPNSPASKADIKIGDKLLMVNGTDLSGMSTTDFIKNVVKGSGATEFVIALERDGIKKEITLKKEAITLESVSSTTYYENGKRIAYIKVSIFAENTYSQFKNTLSKLESEGFESLIIDLRDNSGGHLSTVKNMISLFLDSSHVIYQTEDKKGKEKVYSSGKITKNYPIVIVGNSMSASASEVMIGALTEEYGAILIGNQSFGKGTVQELHSLTNGDEYKFTTKKWLTPKGNWVHNNGIKPNVEVTLSKDYYENPIQENDNQLRTAINYLAGVQYK